jgi:hypothetical protein
MSETHTLFSYKYHSFFLDPVYHPYNQRIIILDAVFLKVSLSHIIHSEFLVLTHSVPGMLISEGKKNSKSKVISLECTVVVICCSIISGKK